MFTIVKKALIANAIVLGFAATALACGGADSPSSTGGSDPEVKGSSGGSSSGAASSSGGSSSGGSSSGGSSSGGSSSGGSSSGGSSSGSSGGGNCLDVAGSWTGPVDGKARSQNNADLTQAVTGTATVKLTAKDKDNFEMPAGSSKFDVQIDTGTILGKVSSTQELTGTVKCGKLEATSEATVVGQHLAGTASCTFDANGCSGTFEVHDDQNAPVAKGTFKLAK